MDIIINEKVEMTTKSTLKEIAQKIKNNMIEVVEEDNLIYWGNVFAIRIKL